MAIFAGALLVLPVVAKLAFRGRPTDQNSQSLAFAFFATVLVGTLIAAGVTFVTAHATGIPIDEDLGAVVIVPAVLMILVGRPNELWSLGIWLNNKVPNRIGSALNVAVVVGWPLITPTVWGE